MDFVYFSKSKIVLYFIETMVIWRMCMGTSEGLFRTIGGRDALPHEFPYAVRLENRYSRADNPHDGAGVLWNHDHVCTAAVLTSTATLCAAHCYEPLDKIFEVLLTPENALIRIEHSMVIRYGSATGRPSDDDSFSKVLGWFRSPSARSYMHTVMIDDLALLKTQPISLIVYARVSAIDYRTAFGQRVAILGYGHTNGSKGLDDTLELGLPLQVVDAMWSKCDLDLPFPYPLVCAVEPCSHHAAVCKGDSGGPVLHASGVVGVSAKAPVDNNCQMRTDALRASATWISSFRSVYI